MGALVEVQSLSAQAFQGLETAVWVCASGMLAVIALVGFRNRFGGMPAPSAASPKGAKRSWTVLGLLLMAGILQLPASAQAQGPGESPGQTLSSADKYPRFGLSHEEGQLVQGKKVYETYCMGCHGIKGDGLGPAASFLDPKPRNFQTAEYRFSSRPSGDVPTDQDLFRTITEGLHGSSMPAWNLMPESDRWAVIAYLKTFAPDKWKFAPGLETSIAEDPYVNQPKEAAIKRGETAYHGMAMCYSCHAAYVSPDKINEARAVYGMPPLKAFRKDLGSVMPLQTTDGSVIMPPDFVWNKLKRGAELNTLYHVVANGITGTPMPTWKGILPEEDLWGIVYYVRELASRRPSLVTEADIRAYYDQVAKVEQDRIAYEESVKLADQEALKKAEADKKAAAAAAVVKTVTAAVTKAPEVKEPPRA